MIKQLKSFQNEKSYICIHSDATDPGKFVFGRIVGVDADWFAVSMVSPDGEYDGVLMKRIDDVIRIERSERYAGKMKILMDARGYEEKEASFPAESVLLGGLVYAKEHRLIASVELDHSGFDDITGYIEDVGEEVCEMSQLDEDGREDGTSYFTPKDISQVCIDSTDERRLSILNQGMT